MGQGQALWDVIAADSPIVATAIHNGHEIRPALQGLLVLGDDDRFREEDPYTDRLAAVAPTRVVPRRSRFEVDLNRPRERAVYREPADAWGLELWREPPPEDVVEASLADYDAFYALMERILTERVERHGRFVLLDVHSYNHRRAGPDAPPEDLVGNPEVNVGTGSMERVRWEPLVERFLADLSTRSVAGQRLDVRENVRFLGGHLSSWVHATFPGSGCALALEFKKTFMDEWTGRADDDHLEQLQEALASTLPGLLKCLA